MLLEILPEDIAGEHFVVRQTDQKVLLGHRTHYRLLLEEVPNKHPGA